jgi:hypothetical protein
VDFCEHANELPDSLKGGEFATLKQNVSLVTF